MLDGLFDDTGGGEEAEGAVIGIDLGTTNSVVAAVRGGKVEVLASTEGHRLHPSVVAFLPNGRRFIGMAGRLRRIIDPLNTVYSAKRIIGQAFRSDDVQAAISHLPYRVEEGDNQEPVIVTRNGRDPVPAISGYLLAHIKAIAEQQLGEPVSHCVVTVPANFSDGQREATRQAAELAGMEVLRVLNEPTAAALAYGADQHLHQRIAVFDLGGGTFDLTILAVRDDLYEVIATGGDPFLGGDDLDQALATMLANEFLMRHRIDPRTDPQAMAKLLIGAEQIKMQLSEKEVVEGKISELAFGPGGVPLDLEFRVERPQLEKFLEPIVSKAIQCAESVFAEAGVTPQRVDEVLLVGGCTRMPAVRQRVTEYFGKQPRTAINPMEIVAVGAALHAHSLFGPPDENIDTNVGLLMDVTSHALGIATVGGYAETLIEKNTTIPAESTREFSTAQVGQSVVRIRVCQGQSKQFDDNVPVGELRLTGLAPPSDKKARVEVSFLLDADGILQVTAKDVDSGRDERATLSRVGVTAQTTKS